MKLVTGPELADLLEGRENLLEWLGKIEAEGIFLLTDFATGPAEDRAGRKTPMFLVKSNKGEGHTYFVQSKPKARGKEDSFLSWLIYEDILTEQGKNVVVIDKSKLGRRKRETSEEERQAILERRRLKQSINTIAREMKLGTARISQVIREAGENDLFGTSTNDTADTQGTEGDT